MVPPTYLGTGALIPRGRHLPESNGRHGCLPHETPLVISSLSGDPTMRKEALFASGLFISALVWIVAHPAGSGAG
jgi:hypothetical protein